MQLPDTFDARTVQPNQGGGAHPVGMFDFQITHTYLQDTKDKQGAMLVVELTSPAGKIENRYNIINKSPQAMEIAQKELSALCHAVNIFDVAFPKNPDRTPIYNQAGHTLRGGRGRMSVVAQTDKDGKPNGYVEVEKVFDIHGNEPGKSGGGQPQPQQGFQQQPQQQQPQNQPNQNWQPGPAPQQNTQQPNNQGGGWNAGGGQQQAPQQNSGWGPGPQPQANNQGSGQAPWSK